MPVLVAVGTKDDVAGSAQELAALLPAAARSTFPDRDHMLAVGDRVFKEAVLDFLVGAAVSRIAGKPLGAAAASAHIRSAAAQLC